MKRHPGKKKDIVGLGWEAPTRPGFPLLSLPALLALFKSLADNVPKLQRIDDRPYQRRKKEDAGQDEEID